MAEHRINDQRLTALAAVFFLAPGLLKQSRGVFY